MKTPHAGIGDARFSPFPGLRPMPTWCLAALLLTVAVWGTVGAEDAEDLEYSVIAPLAPKYLALDAAAAGDALFAVGARGHVLITEDGGTTWNQARVPTRSSLTGVHFHDRNLGWAVGHDAVILRTTDGGETWERVHWAPEDEAPFFDVWFSDADNGVAIGAYGSYFTTTDGGATWEYEPIAEDDWHLHQIARSDTGKLYIAAEAGFVYRSDDEGATWKELPSPYEGSFFGILPLEGDTVLLFGLRGHLFRSDDSGETWEELETGTVAMLTNGVVTSDGTIVISGLAGAVLISTDGGRTFELRQQPSRRGISAAVDLGGGSLLVVGDFGVKTTTVDELSTASN